MSRQALVVGCGYVGSEIARLLLDRGWQVSGVSRSGTVPDGVVPITTDICAPQAPPLPKADLVIYGVSPSGRDAAAYQAAYVTGVAHALTARTSDAPFVLLSSTGIYGMSDGRWVDEAMDPCPSSETGKVLQVAESAVLAAGGTALRLGGIYGPGRTGGIARACNGGTRYVNRIHRDDAAAAALFLGLNAWEKAQGKRFNGVDSQPATGDDVLAWLQQQFPTHKLPSTAPMNRPPRHGSHKRCCNQRLLDLGFSFRYPTFRDGYAPLIES